jgi:hypothetical protein
MWTGTATYPGSTPASDEDIDFELYCSGIDDDDPSHPGKNFTLRWGDPVCCVANPGGCDGSHVPSSSSTCDPFNLIFGPFTLSTGDLTCNACQDYDPEQMEVEYGTYYIIITETTP